jgi:hypothetical protein
MSFASEIIASILIAGNLTCPFTKLEIPAGERPNALDIATVKRARKHCRELYSKSPCAKVVLRQNQLDYQVVCGTAVTSKK